MGMLSTQNNPWKSKYSAKEIIRNSVWSNQRRGRNSPLAVKRIPGVPNTEIQDPSIHTWRPYGSLKRAFWRCHFFMQW